MSFPRIAVHTGNSVVITNKHPEWAGTIVIQHNETTSTMLRHGPNMTAKAKLRHPPLSTWQSNCRAPHWAPYNTPEYDPLVEDYNVLLFGETIKDGQVVVPVVDNGVAVAEPVGH